MLVSPGRMKELGKSAMVYIYNCRQGRGLGGKEGKKQEGGQTGMI